MKSVVLLFTFVLVTPLIIHADKDYSCPHVNATFGAPVGSKNCTGLFVSTVPLDACGEIESNLTDSIALIIKNASSIGCSAARQVFNVQEAGAIGAVVMNSPISWFDNFEIVDADDKDDFNITIPVIGILYQSGYQIFYMLKDNSSITATISTDFECMALFVLRSRSSSHLVGECTDVFIRCNAWFVEC